MTLKELIDKYRAGKGLTPDELKQLVEELDSVSQTENSSGDSKIAASYLLSRIAAQIDDLQESITANDLYSRSRFDIITEILQNKNPSIGAHTIKP